MTKIYLVRHAEVQNPKSLIYGRLGFFKLSKRGLEQARGLGDYFESKKIDAIYCSPMLRARQTAKGIAKGKIPIHYCQDLTEANYKKWEGKPFAARPKKDLELYFKTPTKLRAGETVAEILARMQKILIKIVKRHPDQNIIVVSHADPILTLRMFYENRPLDEMAQTTIKKASITSLVFNKDLECKEVAYKEVVEAEEDIR